MRVYLHRSAEAIALEDPLALGQRVRWFVRRPSDVQKGHPGDLFESLGIDASAVNDEDFMIEDHDGWYPGADDDDAVWLEGTIMAFPPTGRGWPHGHVLVDLDDVSTRPHHPTD